MAKLTPSNISMTQEEVSENLRRIKAFKNRGNIPFDFQDSIMSNALNLEAAEGGSDPVDVLIYPVSWEDYPTSWRPIDLEYLSYMISRP